MDEVKLFKCLADGNRMRIIRLLSERKYCVKALAKQLGISEPAVSQHMRLLKETGLVIIGEKNGYNIHYAVNKDKLMELSCIAAEMAEKVQAERQCGGNCRKDKK